MATSYGTGRSTRRKKEAKSIKALESRSLVFVDCICAVMIAYPAHVRRKAHFSPLLQGMAYRRARDKVLEFQSALAGQQILNN